MARKIDLPETKGAFQLSGVVSGVASKKFYSDKPTKTGKPRRDVNFGVGINSESVIYVNLNGMEKDEVNFYKKAEKKGEKGTTKKIKWANRDNFKEEGFKILGVNIGLVKKLDKNGKEVNDTKYLIEYDACKYVSENLKDKESVFIKGKIEYSSFKNDKDEVTRNKKFIPSQISACKPIDFEADDFEETSDFQQRIIFTGIEKDDSNKEDIKFIVSAKIVTYNTIEETEFIIRDKGLADKLRKNLKPYNSIDVWGKINNRVDTDQVEDDEEDTWGEENKMDKAKVPHIKELVITGADPKSIDKDTYTEENIEEAIRAIKEFGESNSSTNDGNWGSTKGGSATDDEEEPWG